MNKFLTLFFFILFSSTIFAGTGTEADPFTVAQAIAKTDGSSKTYWVKGYVVGEISDFSNNKYFYELAPPFDGTSAYLLADNPDEINLSKCMPIQLGSERANSMNLDENPQYWRKQIVACGLLRDYFALPGLKTLSDLQVLSAQPLTNEASKWNFFEDMDGSYAGKSTGSIFAGGTYTGETGTWKLEGATWGNTSNDKKWDKASARLRLTEGSTGNPGYMQMQQDKPNGIGTVRFWAGYYDTDNGGSISLYISKNQGADWEKVINSQSIAKDWKEYQFTINQTGNIRLKIMKAENGSAGINIDKIRISDYTIISSVKQPTNDGVRYTATSEVLSLTLIENLNQVKLFALTGQCIWSKELKSGSFHIPVQSGIYLLKVNSKSYKVICK